MEAKKKAIWNPLLELIQARVTTRFERFVLRRAIETESRRRRPLVGGWSFATDYAFAVEDAVCEYVDLLIQTAMAGRGVLTRKVRDAISDEAVRLADQLKSWKYARTFFAITMGVKHPNKFPSGERKAFMKELETFEAGWRIEANNQIWLRSVLSRRAQPPRRNLNNTQMQIAVIREKYPNLSQRLICAKLDAYNDHRKNAAPLPESWQKAGFRLWTSVYDDRKFKSRVKKYISSVPVSQRSSRIPRRNLTTLLG